MSSELGGIWRMLDGTPIAGISCGNPECFNMDLNVRMLRRPSQVVGRRLRTNWSANLEADEIRTPCRVIDISAEGASLSAPAEFGPDGDACLILEHTSPIRGSIVWREKDRIGFRFCDRQDWVQDDASKRFDPTAWLQ